MHVFKQNNYSRKKCNYLHYKEISTLDVHMKLMSTSIHHILSMRQDVIGETPSEDMATQFVVDD